MRPCLKKIFFLAVVFALVNSTLCQAQSGKHTEADLVRQTELTRIRALVDKNIEVARQLHADEFQLIEPEGIVLTKKQYLDGLVNGVFYYKKYEPGNMEVRMYGDAAAIRYKAQVHIVVMDQDVGDKPTWYTNIYEKRDGRWQVVWSQVAIVK